MTLGSRAGCCSAFKGSISHQDPHLQVAAEEGEGPSLPQPACSQVQRSWLHIAQCQSAVHVWLAATAWREMPWGSPCSLPGLHI